MIPRASGGASEIILGIGNFKRKETFVSVMCHSFLRMRSWDFPGGALVRNPHANAGDTGSVSGPGRSHMPWSNLSLCTTTTEPARLEPVFLSKCSHHNEKPTHHSEVAPAHRN